MITGVTKDKVKTPSDRRYANENRERLDTNTTGAFTGGQKRMKNSLSENDPLWRKCQLMMIYVRIFSLIGTLLSSHHKFLQAE
jgi:hypothetical protein